MNVKWWHIMIFVAVILAVAAILHPTKLRMGWMYLHSGQAYEAIKKLEEAYEKDPSNYRALRAYAGALESAGMTDEAEEAYARLIEIKPREDHFQEVVRFYSWMENPRKRKEVLEKWYKHRTTLEKGFEDEEGLRILNNLYAHYLMDQEYEQALAILKELRMIDPKNRKKINNDLITIYEKTGDVDGTMTHLEVVMEEDPDNAYALEKFVQLAMLSDRKGDAEGHLAKNVERHPDDEAAWQRIINFETNMKDYEAANMWWKKRLVRKPSDAKLGKSYFDWLLATEQQDLAISYIEGLPKKTRDEPYYRDMLLKLYEWNQETGKLIPIYRANFRANPRDRENAQKLIWLLYDHKEYSELEGVLKKLNEIYPANKEYAIQLADVQDLRQEDAAAIKTLERAARDTDDNEILKRLGERLLWSSGDTTPQAPAKASRPDGTMKKLSK